MTNNTSIPFDNRWTIFLEEEKWIAKTKKEPYCADYIVSIVNNNVVVENKENYPDNIDDGYIEVPFSLIQKLIDLKD